MRFSQTQITKHSHRQKYSYCIRVYEQHQFPLTILNEKVSSILFLFRCCMSKRVWNISNFCYTRQTVKITSPTSPAVPAAPGVLLCTRSAICCSDSLRISNTYVGRYPSGQHVTTIRLKKPNTKQNKIEQTQKRQMVDALFNVENTFSTVILHKLHQIVYRDATIQEKV